MTTKTLEDIRRGPIKTEDATLRIQMPAEKLDIGSHDFQLQVTDNAGNVSQPARITLIVIDDQAPTAVLRVTDIEGRVLSGNRIGFNREFILNATGSVDSGGGNIVSYTWTLA